MSNITVAGIKRKKGGGRRNANNTICSFVTFNGERYEAISIHLGPNNVIRMSVSKQGL